MRHFEKVQQETMRHFDVVAEGLRGDIRQVAEGHSILVEKIGALDGRVGRVEERIDRIEIKVDALDKKVDALDEKLDGFIADTGANFDDVRSAIKFSYAELDRRVSQLENMVLQLSARVQRLEELQKSQ